MATAAAVLRGLMSMMTDSTFDLSQMGLMGVGGDSQRLYGNLRIVAVALCADAHANLV
jgi:hypothetical protein